MKKLASVTVFILLTFLSYSQEKSFPPPGKLVDVNGYKIHLLVEGEEEKQGPTVVFFHGAGDIALHWNLVLPEVGKFAQAIAVDQNGEGWSEHGHGMGMNQQVYDTYHALKNGGFEGPYIIVGHSLGGIIANLFAAKYKEEVVGVVFVDATHPDVVLKVKNKKKNIFEWKKMRLTADEPIPEINTSQLAQPQELFSFQPKRDFNNSLKSFSEYDKKLFNWIYNERPWTYHRESWHTYEAEFFKEMYENPDKYHLGNIPLVVLSRGIEKEYEGDENWSSDELIAHYKKLQMDHLKVSNISRQVIANKSGHHIHLDQPDLVVEEIRKLIESLKK